MKLSLRKINSIILLYFLGVHCFVFAQDSSPIISTETLQQWLNEIPKPPSFKSYRDNPSHQKNQPFHFYWLRMQSINYTLFKKQHYTTLDFKKTLSRSKATPLHIALDKKWFQVSQYILNNGGDPLALDAAQFTPMDILTLSIIQKFRYQKMNDQNMKQQEREKEFRLLEIMLDKDYLIISQISKVLKISPLCLFITKQIQLPFSITSKINLSQYLLPCMKTNPLTPLQLGIFFGMDYGQNRMFIQNLPNILEKKRDSILLSLKILIQNSPYLSQKEKGDQLAKIKTLNNEGNK